MNRQIIISRHLRNSGTIYHLAAYIVYRTTLLK